MPTNNSPTLSPVEFRYARLILLTALISVGFGFTVLFAILGPLGREVGMSELQISSIIAASSLVVFLASPRWGRLSDRWGRKRVMVIGLFGYACGNFLFASVFHLTLIGALLPLAGYLLLMLTRVMHASVMSAIMPASSAYMADITSVATRTKGMGAVGAANNFGSILGPALGGLLAGITLLTPLWVASAVAITTALFVIFLLPDIPKVAPSTGQSRGSASQKLGYFDPRILPYIIVGALMFMGMALVQQTLAFRFQDVLGLTAVETAQTFGIAMGCSAAASLVSQIGLMQRINLTPFQWLRVALPILAIAFACLALADTRNLMITAMVLQGAGMGLAGPAFMAGASLAVEPHEQGAVAGIAGSCGPLGFTVGPLLGGFFYQISPDLPYWFTFAIYLPLLVFVMRQRRGEKRLDQRIAAQENSAT
ncbi:MAG: MFS transporter [Gammaproteobacteria bacterium]|nr:MFS transporter [Gammaproteobacteria bacterium]MBP74651.1 MFS transporter [Gammaproteobacteria bacterium]HBX00965.1 MFS transporter [Gammaproteobacteria bacterium]